MSNRENAIAKLKAASKAVVDDAEKIDFIGITFGDSQVETARIDDLKQALKDLEESNEPC